MATSRFRNPTTGRFAKNPTVSGFMTDNLTPGIEKYADKVVENVLDVMREFARDMVKDAKENAPWADRTGLARQGLDSAVQEGGDILSVYLFHTIEYGKWLEIRWDGTYAIIMPTIEKMGPELMRRLEKVV